jgi:carboxypeptidase C (cathepsin A)
VTVGGQRIAFTATAGLQTLRDAGGKPTAEIFYIAYTRKGAANAATRPLTFSFNGGLGSSSVWLHLGLLGPRRVSLREDGFAVPPPYELVENESSLLDETDLVFSDPVGTGYSRASKPEEASIKNLLELLDAFVEAGWPEALNLVWRLGGIHRSPERENHRWTS